MELLGLPQHEAHKHADRCCERHCDQYADQTEQIAEGEQSKNALSDPTNQAVATRCGILLYTATAGSLGTLGGLVATATRFSHILAAALRRLQICSNDPVCSDHDPGHRTDDRALHGAACHGCLLIAETSCAMRNVFLDRALIVDTMANGGASLF